MTLHDIVRSLPRLDEELTIYAQSPWSLSSPAIAAVEPEVGGMPDVARRQSLVYFIEISIAREFLQDWVNSKGGRASTEEQCERLIQYAQNDA